MELMKKLFSVTSVAGYESKMKELIKMEVSQYADDIYEDNFGNLIVVSGKKDETVINTSISEDGLFVTDFKDGIAKCSPIGKLEPEALKGGKVVTESGIYALCAVKTSKEGKSDIADLSLDFLGQDNIKIGDILAPCLSYSEQNGYVTGNSAGIRAGIYILINIIKRNKDKSFKAVFSVKDNTGFKGAKVAFENLSPNEGYIIGRASCDNKATEIKLGKGPCLRLMDKGVVFTKSVIDSLVSKLKLEDYQKEIVTEGMNTPNRVSYLNNGIPVININCPVKYAGTFNETVSMSDINKIINAFCK